MTGCDTRRHDLLQPSAAGWSWLLQRRPDLAMLPGVRDWAKRDLPVMRRRRQPGDAAKLVPVAVALPPQQGRLRLAFQMPVDGIASVRSPPSLADVLALLPAPWRQRGGTVLRQAEARVVPRLYGSALWQAVTGLGYLREGSDLDLLWPVSLRDGSARHVPDLLAMLGRIDGSPGPRLDGEIVLEDVGAVNWRELAGDACELLVKRTDDVVVMRRAGFLASASC